MSDDSITQSHPSKNDLEIFDKPKFELHEVERLLSILSRYVFSILETDEFSMKEAEAIFLFVDMLHMKIVREREIKA